MAKHLQLIAENNARPLWRLDIAESWLGRLRGLMWRQSLTPGEGLYLPGTNSIHMMFMRFPIDCVFVSDERSDGTRQVIAVRERLAPWTGIVWWARGARGAIELQAGAFAASGLRVGDPVRLAPVD